MNNFSILSKISIIPLIGLSLSTMIFDFSIISNSDNYINVCNVDSTIDQGLTRDQKLQSSISNNEFNSNFLNNNNIVFYFENGNNPNSAAYCCTEGELMADYIFNGSVYDLVNKLITIIRTEEDDDYTSSEFLSKNYERDSSLCIKLIKEAIEFDSYKYAKEVLRAIRFSNINYFDKWFKNILIDCKNVDKIKGIANNFYLLYKETFEAL